MAARFSYDGFDGASTVHANGMAIDTGGLKDTAGLAIRSERNDRCWLRLRRESETWQRILLAMETGEPFHERIDDVLLRKGSALDKSRPCDVTIGRRGANICISMRPTTIDAPHDGLEVQLARDDARIFAAMMRADSMKERYRLVEAQKGKASNLAWHRDSTTAAVQTVEKANAAQIIADQKRAIRNALHDSNVTKKERTR